MEEVELCLKNELVDIACICELWSVTEDYVSIDVFDTILNQELHPMTLQ